VTIAASALVVLAALATGQATPSYDSYKSWFTACDNVLTCEAKGFEAGTSDYPDLRFTRDGGPAANTEVVLSAPFSAGATDLQVDGKPLPLDAAAWKIERRDDFSTFSTDQPAAVDALIAQLRNARRLQLGAHASIPLDGLVAALLRMDDRQGRVGGVTALIRKGPAPATKVPAPPPLPIVPIRSATSSLSPGEDERLIARVKATRAALIKNQQCQADDELQDTAAYALDARSALVFIPCALGAYQGSSLVFVIPRGSGTAAPFNGALPFGKADDGTFQLTEPDFDPKTGSISTFGKGRGLADCGLSARWIWNGNRFQLSEAAFQGACGGSSPGDWPTLYRSK
jgi:hypothetical protein